jgi:hypothetical protein
MQQEQSQITKTPINISFDDFEISAESFKPVTKGLGFHHEQKKTTFKPTSRSLPENTRATLPLSKISNETALKVKAQAPSGLEAFYSTSQAGMAIQPDTTPVIDNELISTNEITGSVSSTVQVLSWSVDLILVLSLVALTGISLVMASGIEYRVILKLISKIDIAVFSGSVFAIYYILYFTILDLSSTPGKLLFGIRLVGTDKNNFSIKNTFIRSLISLLSIFIFCLPMLLDFQGRLSDTKLVK